MRKADILYKYSGQNPFYDSQARNYSDEKVTSEFYPISIFWDLFNDQHEIILGTRGSGKTFLLKMMRYSMLKKLSDPKAKKILKEKRFISFYVPMHLEFVTCVAPVSLDSNERKRSFQIAFNLLLAKSIIRELKAILDDIDDLDLRAVSTAKVSYEISRVWLNEKAVYDLSQLDSEIDVLYSTFSPTSSQHEKIPNVFCGAICAPLVYAKNAIMRVLQINTDPTWIVCIDEAEFLDNDLQICINNVFRSDSNRIAVKLATLPYAHTTLDTFMSGIKVSAGNDFYYHVIDLAYDSKDFINLTNKLCSHRINSRVDSNIGLLSLEDFLGKETNDDLIDYYRKEVGKERADRMTIEQDIINSFSNERKKGSLQYKNKRKTIYDKFAPIYFTREMYKLSKQGHSVPGWYAGAKMVRKISQGNPRAFLNIMNMLFNEAKEHKLTAKKQHNVLYHYCLNYCESTKALNEIGPIMHEQLMFIANKLKERVHGDALISAGAGFKLEYNSDEDFEKNRTWICEAIANSRLIVGNMEIEQGISKSTQFVLSNTYAAAYWIPMRSDIPYSIRLSKLKDRGYKVSTKMKKAKSVEQLSLLEDEYAAHY